ncbi:MAG TPA: ATP-binding protein [Thermoanaerobaculia bacterium]|nr:ATP-binding protein [Thermoanaerobaculia bacterium]
MINVPLDAISPAAATMGSVLAAAGASAAIVGEDRSVKFVSDELRKLIGDVTTTRQLEQTLAVSLADLRTPSSSTVTIADRKMLVSIVPFAAGAAVVLRPIFDAPPQISDVPKIGDVIRSVVNRYITFAELKSIEFEVSVAESDESFRHHDQLADALGMLVDNSLHYVPTGGQIVIGARPMEQKGKPVLLFFVMDNGPLVPEHMKHVIFESGFVWNPQSHERTGGGLSKVREFAAAHGGVAWVDSKTQKACSFFLRVEPDR